MHPIYPNRPQNIYSIGHEAWDQAATSPGSPRGRGEKYNTEVVTEHSIEHESRGALVDRTTQRWVRATGRRVALDECPWLEGPVGDVDVIGADFFARFADREGLTMVADGPPARPGRGLLGPRRPDLRSLPGGCAGRAVLRTDLRVRVRRLVGVAWRIPALWQCAGRDL